MAPIVGKWLRIDLGDQTFLAYGYLDPTAGWSAKGVQVQGQPTPEQCRKAMEAPETTLRLPMGRISALPDAEVPAYGLAEPAWMQFYRVDTASRPWAADSRLTFHAQYPNDLQVSFFFSETKTVEQMWVRLSGGSGDAYEGTLLNTPRSKPGMREGDRVTVRPTPGSPLPVWVSPVIADNLKRYRGGCAQCGFDLVVAPIDDLIRASFPDAPPGAQMVSFTTRCAMCQGTQVLEATSKS